MIAAANRSYYAMFHCIRALLVADGVDYKKHSMVIGHFRREYVKTGIFDTKFSEYIDSAFDIRTRSDYDDFYLISKSKVEQQIKNAKEFYDKVKHYLDK